MTEGSFFPEPGRTLLDKYLIEGVLGAGGMGTVVAAKHLQLGSRVAIKFLRPELTKQPDLVGRFLREARMSARIKSEHVTRVFDVGEADGTPYIVLEHLEGQGLDDRLAKGGPLPVADAVGYVLQAMEALAEAHALGIIHRDLKPSNLFLLERRDGMPFVKVLDFGISKETDLLSTPMALTTSRQILGSPQYMSPEQLASSRDVDAGTDIWALGVVLYELLTGKAPFDAISLPALCSAILNDDPPDLRTVRPEIPAPLAATIADCLQKDRTRRPASVGALAARLAPFAPDAAESARRVRRVLGESVAPAAAPTVIGPTAAPTVARRRAGAVVPIVLAAVAIAGVAAWAVSRRRPEANAPAATSPRQPAGTSRGGPAGSPPTPSSASPAARAPASPSAAGQEKPPQEQPAEENRAQEQPAEENRAQEQPAEENRAQEQPAEDKTPREKRAAAPARPAPRSRPAPPRPGAPNNPLDIQLK